MKDKIKHFILDNKDKSSSELKKQFRLRMQQGDPIFNYLILTATCLILLTFLIGGAVLIGKVNSKKAKTEKTINLNQVSGEVYVLAPDNKQMIDPVTYKLTSAQVAVRQEADTSSPIIQNLTRGDSITVLSQPVQGWVYVNIPNTDYFGYAQKKYIYD